MTRGHICELSSKRWSWKGGLEYSLWRALYAKHVKMLSCQHWNAINGFSTRKKKDKLCIF